MADGSSPYAPEDADDHDGLAALDFFVAEDDAENSGLDAFDDFVQPTAAVDGAGETPEADRTESAAPVITVTNPPGTVTVSAYLDGRVQRVALTRVSNVTESQLADEILVIADLARRKARSFQHASMLDEMRALGHDNASTRDFLERELQLPSPEDASAAEAELFAVRYAGQHD
jgi:hypothetical protein